MILSHIIASSIAVIISIIITRIFNSAQAQKMIKLQEKVDWMEKAIVKHYVDTKK